MDADDCFMTAPMVRKRYAVTDMTLWRWGRNPKVGFPKPVQILNRRYWRLSELLAWEKAREDLAA